MEPYQGRHRGRLARTGYLLSAVSRMPAQRRYDLTHCPVCAWSQRLLRPCPDHQYQPRHRCTRAGA